MVQCSTFIGFATWASFWTYDPWMEFETDIVLVSGLQPSNIVVIMGDYVSIGLGGLYDFCSLVSRLGAPPWLIREKDGCEGYGRHIDLIQDKDRPTNVRIATRKWILDKINKLIQSRTQDYELKILTKILVVFHWHLHYACFKGKMKEKKVRRESNTKMLLSFVWLLKKRDGMIKRCGAHERKQFS